MSFKWEEAASEAAHVAIRLTKKIAAAFCGKVGMTASVTDNTCDRLSANGKTTCIVRGFVVRSGLGSYDCEVQVGSRTVVCSAVAPVLHPTMGVSQSCMPVEGSSVLVFIDQGPDGSLLGTGVILGVIPDGLEAYSAGESVVETFADSEAQEAGVSPMTESYHSKVLSDTEYIRRADFMCSRPYDIPPGEYALLSHSGAGLHIGAVSTSVRGSELASIRCSSLDDQVRVVSGHFQHFSAAGSHEIYNDCGYITVETSVSPYFPERLGKSGSSMWTERPFRENNAKFEDLNASHTQVEQDKGQTAISRLQSYSGYLGDLVNVFVSSPKKGAGTNTYDSDASTGLFHGHIDSSGRVTVRSAAGILLERFDRIPIPKRKKQPWDPGGDDMSSGDEPGHESVAYEVPDEYPGAVGLALGDMSAWWSHLAYRRFCGLTGDFSVEKTSDLKVPENEYDSSVGSEETFDKYDSRHSYIGLTPDGGIVLRDAWGSEIVMAGGKITLNAASDIEIRSGKSTVVMAGDDAIVKGYNSVDVTATNKDVRIKAEKNLQAVSMTSGVLIQSKSKSDNSDWTKGGEEAVTSGITLFSNDSSVSLLGKSAHIGATKAVNIETLDDDQKPVGDIVIAGKRASIIANDGTNIVTKDGKSGLLVSSGQVISYGDSIVNASSRSLANINGGKFEMGLPGGSAGKIMTQIKDSLKKTYDRYAYEFNWLLPYKVEDRKDIRFSYRTTKEYGTDKSSEIFPPGAKDGEFLVYQPSWSVLAGKRRWMTSVATQTWDEKEDEYDGQCPWPGKDAIDGMSYVTLEESNVTSDGLESVKDGDGYRAKLTPTGFSSYHIRKTV